jgi:hypothetical protein
VLLPGVGVFASGCVGAARRAISGRAAGRAVDDGVLAGVGEDLELVRAVAADGAGVGRHRAVLQAQAVEDGAVGAEHRVVAAPGGVAVTVEGVGILHRELAAPHQAEARPPLVAELGLDVVEIFRQLLVAAQLLAGDVGHHLFAGGLQREVALVPVLEAQQLGAHLVPAAGLLPQLGRLHQRHQQFDRAGPVHLLADDVLDLADHPQAHRQVVVDAGAEPLDQARTHHQPVADHFRVGGRFLLGGDEELGGFHGVAALKAAASRHRLSCAKPGRNVPPVTRSKLVGDPPGARSLS